jgi:hypothetical protein
MSCPARATGPATKEGKRKVSQNARKHGFRAASQTLTPIQEQEIAQEIAIFAQDFPPQSPEERATVTQLGQNLWTLKQFDKLEAEQYRNPDYEQAACRLATLARYRARYERLFYRALDALIGKLHKQTPPRPKSEIAQTNPAAEEPPPTAIHGKLSKLRGLLSVRSGTTCSCRSILPLSQFQRVRMCLRRPLPPPKASLKSHRPCRPSRSSPIPSARPPDSTNSTALPKSFLLRTATPS